MDNAAKLPLVSPRNPSQVARSSFAIISTLADLWVVVFSVRNPAFSVLIFWRPGLETTTTRTLRGRVGRRR